MVERLVQSLFEGPSPVAAGDLRGRLRQKARRKALVISLDEQAVLEGLRPLVEAAIAGHSDALVREPSQVPRCRRWRPQPPADERHLVPELAAGILYASQQPQVGRHQVAEPPLSFQAEMVL